MSKEGVNNSNYRHGMRHTKFYMIWADMKKRCDNAKCVGYEDYGGRGIKYCDTWHEFKNFMNDMLEGYKEGLSLERKDVNGNYCKDNCAWIEFEEQSRNHRKRKDNISGITGVHRNTKFNKRVGKEYPNWTACWRDVEGKTRNKGFSVRKYGELGAFIKACKYRDDGMKSLENSGISYGEYHGL